jgi:hypothetical protein
MYHHHKHQNKAPWVGVMSAANANAINTNNYRSETMLGMQPARGGRVCRQLPDLKGLPTDDRPLQGQSTVRF